MKINRWLQKIALILVISCWPIAQVVAQNTFEATVVDAITREPLPFASIYVNAASSTITNREGGFSVSCDSTAVLRISYVGYEIMSLPCTQLSPVIALSPIEQKIQEVVVLPYPLKKFIRQTTKETLKQLQKFRKHPSKFFYRQTAFNDSTCYELLESFLIGHAAVALRDLQLVKGRYAGIRSDSIHKYSFFGNFFTCSQIEFASRSDMPLYSEDIVPLFRNYQRFYDVDYDVIGDQPDRIIVLYFEPKPEVERPIVATTIYVDEQTLHVRKLEGQLRNIIILKSENEMGPDSVPKIIKKAYRSTFDFVVNMTEEHGFTEVQSVYVAEQHGQDEERQFTRSLLFNLGEEDSKVGEKQLMFGDNLHNCIEEQDYDADFWRQNEVVKRTPVEEAVMQLFEDKKLFGVWK